MSYANPRAPWHHRGRRALWSVATGIGALAGAWAGVQMFPMVRFAEHPTGQFHPAMLGMAALVGFGFALAQGLLLAFWRPGGFSLARIALWLPLTTLAVGSMIMPLWWVDAEVLILAPIYAMQVMGPGILALALAQGLLAARSLRGRTWARWTVIGGIAGSLAGLPVAAFLGSLIPVEAAWAGAVAAILAAFQGGQPVRSGTTGLIRTA